MSDEEDINEIIYMNYDIIRDGVMAGNLPVNSFVRLNYLTNDYKCFKFLKDFNFHQCTILHLAIFVQDEKFIEYLLKNNVDFHQETEDFAPAIYSTIWLNKLEYTKKLVEASADVNLHAYVYYQHELEVQKFDSPGLSPGDWYHHDYTPLGFAVHMNAYDIAEFLIIQGAEVNYQHSWGSLSPLSLAAQSNNIKMMKLLMKHGADINFVNVKGGHDSPLRSAVELAENFDAVKLLISQPTIEIDSVNFWGNSSLHLVIGSIHEEDRVRLHKTNLPCILDAGCDVNLENNEKQLAFEFADRVQNVDNQDCVKVLKKHIVKLIAAEFYVCDRNAKAVAGPEFNSFRVECNQEIQILKKIRDPMTGFLYYDLLHKCIHKLALRFKSGDEIIQDAETRSKLPLYGGMIIHRMEKVKQRRKLFNQVENNLYRVFYRYLPATLIHNLFFHLSYVELQKLIEK